ncbi:MAG: AMP-binding protein, partial [Candidatus Competibacteraceae bacterium]|nr:AMP-binding protein [Candidatus Competibacteraceae bacterium]
MSSGTPTATPEGVQTFPRLLFRHAEVRGDAPAIREKDLGIWQTWTWSDVAERVRALASGLAALGFKRGDNLAIIGDNRPHLYMMMSAAQCLGGVPVPLYQDAVADEMLFVLEDATIRFAAVEDQEQVDKLLEVLHLAPKLEHIIYDDPRGMRHYTEPFLHDIHALMEMGRIHNRNHPDFLNAEIAQGQSHDVSVMLYTSGTT